MTYSHEELSKEMTRFEKGEMSRNDTVQLFQYLWDTQKINGLSGIYNKTMYKLIGQGSIHLR